MGELSTSLHKYGNVFTTKSQMAQRVRVLFYPTVRGGRIKGSLTDKAPGIKAGEYRYMTQGGSDEKDSVDVPIARDIIANAVQK
jgi:hypothetical protein